MQSKRDSMTIEELINLRKDGLLLTNWEYQRGAVWNEKQIRLLIDSILRDYQTPLIYLRKIKRGQGEYESVSLEIIDGQQRINSLWGFTHGVIINERPEGVNNQSLKPLIDPQSEEGINLLPVSLQERPCDWAGKTFQNFSSEQKDKFLKTKVPVVIMECTDDETRDLFIRLQGGSSLTAQEIRDSWPGNFCKLVIKIGGKPQQRNLGHAFFQTVMKTKPGGDRGRTRQHVAQLLMLFLASYKNRNTRTSSRITDINSRMIDSYYRQYAGIDKDSDEVKRFYQILDKLTSIFGDQKRKPLKAHDVLHLVLLVDTLWDDYTSEWVNGITKAYDDFAAKIAEAREIQIDEQNEIHQDVLEYYRGTRTASDKRETIERRHEIYVRHMFRLLGDNLVIKDPQRGFSSVMREIIYYRDKKKCFSCDKPVKWCDAEIHHKLAHSKGGKTTLDNGVLMHGDCHRKLHRNS